jgi:L-alanine-DL-glutamate epimerase-like enolase superfamily enzyme
MKITDVRFIALRYPLAEPLRLAWGPMTHRQFGLIEIETDAGITGLGETSVNFPHWSLKERRATVEDGLRHLLVGEDPLRVEALWEKMYRALIRLGLLWGKGAILSAIGGADIALWDIAGHAYGVPVYAMLGGLLRSRIPLYAVGFSAKEPARGAEEWAARGYRAVKVRVGFDAEQDLKMVGEVCRALGPEVDVLVDANMGWDRPAARRMVAALEPYDLYWIEEPLRCDDVAGLAELAAQARTPIAAGENAFDRDDVKRLLLAGAVDFFMPDPTRAGGLTECKKLCGLAQAWEVPYSPHHYGSDVGFAAALHLLASTPGGGYMLRDVSPTPLRDQVLAEPLTIEKGEVRVPDGPGLGIRLNREMVERYAG